MSAEPLLSPGDPPPVEVVNEAGGAPILLTCDHASSAVPRKLGTLGLAPSDLTKHIGWDIGAAAVVRRLARLLDAPAVLSGFSRLVIDCNRPHDSTRQPGSVPDESDRIRIPANQNVTPAQAEARARSCFWPYHRTIEEFLDRFAARGVLPAYLAIHSFTPVMNGFRRPWQVGVCWLADERIARPLLAALRAEPDLNVGDNEPYGFFPGSDYGIPAHAAKRGLPHVLLEVRNDRLLSEAGQTEWAERLARCFNKVLADRSIFRIERHAELLALLNPANQGS